MGTRALPRARLEPPAVRAIVRDRVDRRLDRALEVPLTVVVGPAGAGKTTAASHLVHRNRDVAVWYRAHSVDGREATLTEHLAQAIGAGGGRTELAELLVDLTGRQASRNLLLVIDEFDAVTGTESEEAIGELVPDLPPSVHVVTLSRGRPGFNMSRLRLGDAICEIGPDDLRFRSWEVDQLFRELYQRPLLPDEVAELERKTGGWVAALQLFHLATTSLTPGERRAAIAHVGRRNGPDWDFLADNVLAGLPDELQLFLLETAPLERLTATLCDEVLQQTTSGRQLAELERLQLITPSMDAPGSFRSHEVLRAHLDGLLMEWEGADAVRKRYRCAAEALEHHGLFAESLRAYCRGEDWESATRLLGSRGAEVAARPGSWLVTVPSSVAESDPWLLLAVAREQRAHGRIGDAIESYQRLERSSLSASPVEIARRERLLLASLVDRSSHPSLEWVAALRDAVVADPVAAVTRVPGDSAHELVARGIAELLSGEAGWAEHTLRVARDRGDASPTLSVAASIGLLIASHLAGTARPLDADDLERAAATLEVPFLARLSRAVGGMIAGSIERVEGVAEECELDGDTAGAAAASVLALITAAWGQAAPHTPGNRARELCQARGLRTLEVWAVVAIALATRTREDAAEAEAATRRGSIALQDLAQLAVALSGAGRRSVVDRLATSLHADHGIVVPASLTGVLESGGPAANIVPSLRLRCFGRFTATRGDVAIDLGSLRPRARAVLRMLASHAGTGVHRQTVCDEMWPADDEPGAARKLQVAISSIRKVVDDGAARDVITRTGDMYLIETGRGIECDVEQFEAACELARTRLAEGRSADAEEDLRRAVGLHNGELLPEDGAADWVVARRRQLRAAATDAARSLVTLLLDQGRAAEAIDACRAGLSVDRYDDPLWRALLKALDLDGDLAGHAQATYEYEEVLAELGVTSPTS